MANMTNTAVEPPAMSVAQAYALLTREGSPLEVVTAQVRGETYKVFKNQPPTFRAVWEATKQHAALEYVVFGKERYTYGQSYRLVATLAHLLVTKYGVRKGDRVGVLMRNLPEWIFAWWAALSIGAICVPLNSWLTGEELEFAIADCGAKVLLADAERVDRIAPHFGKLQAVVKYIVASRGDAAFLAKYARGPIAVESYEAVMKSAPQQTELPPVELHTDDDATIMYTSGTTGRPKGALSTHRNGTTMIMVSGMLAARATLRRGEVPAPADPNAPKPVLMLPVPLFHATGNLAILTPGTIGGAKIVLIYKWDPEEALRLIQQEKVTNFIGVPAMLWQMFDHPNFAKYDVSSMQTLGSGGAPAAPEVVTQVGKKFPKAAPGAGWGMTETGAVGLNNGYEDYRRKPDSIGPTVPVCEIRIVDPETLRDLPVNQVGEILIRGPNVMKGYWNRPEANKKEFVEPGHWLRTGDLGRKDEEDFYYIVDRAKDMLLRGGENVYCREIEDVLYSHPAIMDAAVVGLPDRVLGEEVGAAVQVKHDFYGKVTQEAIQSYVRTKLAAFKVPIFIDIRTEPLPRNAAGKILKRDVKIEVVALYEKTRPKAKL